MGISDISDSQTMHLAVITCAGPVIHQPHVQDVPLTPPDPLNNSHGPGNEHYSDDQDALEQTGTAGLQGTGHVSHGGKAKEEEDRELQQAEVLVVQHHQHHNQQLHVEEGGVGQHKGAPTQHRRPHHEALQAQNVVPHAVHHSHVPHAMQHSSAARPSWEELESYSSYKEESEGHKAGPSREFLKVAVRARPLLDLKKDASAWVIDSRR